MLDFPKPFQPSFPCSLSRHEYEVGSHVHAYETLTFQTITNRGLASLSLLATEVVVVVPLALLASARSPGANATSAELALSTRQVSSGARRIDVSGVTRVTTRTGVSRTAGPIVALGTAARVVAGAAVPLVALGPPRAEALLAGGAESLLGQSLWPDTLLVTGLRAEVAVGEVGTTGRLVDPISSWARDGLDPGGELNLKNLLTSLTAILIPEVVRVAVEVSLVIVGHDGSWDFCYGKRCGGIVSASKPPLLFMLLALPHI